MNPERAQRIEDIFERVSEEPPSEQRGRLDELCEGDNELAAEVWALLEADSAQHAILDGSGAELACGLLDSGPGLALPRRFGRFTIRKYLGEGGVGSVYLADRDDLGDTVAIKFLHDSWTSPSRRQRFAAEQRTLAGLNHRYIARLYDAGVTDGTPWFAMEYVEGLPITDFCSARKLDLRERLHLFRCVCEAVRCAHRSLTVHLDLKPANILVNTGGEVKLVDFGIARHLTEAGRAAEKTVTGQRLLSLNYAAPEQIRGESLDVQTDVHALGIVLYELLVGRPPADLGAASAAELARQLQEEPRRPSALALESDAPLVHASRSEWRDLDVMCLTAMHRDRAARYESVDNLIRDVDHFLADEPLDARRGTLRSYRFRKFITRNRRSVAAAAAVVALLSALSIFFTLRLVDARDRAVASETRTRRIHRLMLNLFEGDDSAAGPADGLRVVSLLDRGVREANSLGTERELQAELRHTLGGLYYKLGHIDRAEPLLTAAWTERRSALGDNHPQTVRAQIDLGVLRLDQSEIEDAKRLVGGALEAAKRRPAVDAVEIAAATAALGKVLLTEGQYGAAVPLLEDAVRELSRHPASVELSEALGDLANTQYYLGHVDASEATNLRALALDRQLFGDRHPHVSVDLYNLGNIRLDRGDYPGGEGLFRHALEINETWYGPAHPKTASNLLMLGRSLAYQARLEEAAALYERASAAMRRTYGEKHLRFASVLSLQGDLARDQGQLDRAAQMFDRAKEIFKATTGAQHEFYFHQLSNLGSVQLARKAYPAAEALLRDAVRGLSTAVPDQRYTALAEIRLGAALAGQERYAEAEQHLLAGYEMLRRLTGPAAAELQDAREELAGLYTALKMPSKADEFRLADDR
jgi:serine/threonine-protein kinase